MTKVFIVAVVVTMLGCCVNQRKPQVLEPPPPAMENGAPPNEDCFDSDYNYAGASSDSCDYRLQFVT